MRTNNDRSEFSIVSEQIKHSFGDKRVLEGISFSVRYGEIMGLLGPSGAGKTTLIKILTGQLSQSGGEAFLLGENTGELTRKSYTKIGMVMDQAGLYERLSCCDNLRLFAKLYNLPVSRVEEVLIRTGLFEARKKPADRLSKGMRQRLVLARAVLHSPEVLFLDEPTSGLDPTIALEIHKLIEEERTKGTTVLLTTHNMAEAAKLCDHVALLHEGHIVEYGEPEEICRRYNHQNKIKILLRDGRMIKLNNDPQSAGEISSCFERGQVEAIHSSEPSLESVFMELTGKGFE